MKWIKYKIRQAGGSLVDKAIGWNETNEETAKKESYNGEYIIEDDGQPEPVAEPTADDILNALLGVT